MTNRRTRLYGLPGLAAALLAAAGPAIGAERGPADALPYRPGLDPTSMDLEANPCEDFYQYSCGGWMERNPLPPGQSSWDVYRKLADDTLHLLWGLLESAAKPGQERSPPLRLAGDHFAACMDTGYIDGLGASPLSPTLAVIDAVTSRDELAGLLADLHDADAGGAAFFNYTSLPDFGDAGRITGTFFAGGLGMPDREYYLSDDRRMRDARRQYAAHIERMFVLLEHSRRDARRAARSVLQVETRLARANLSRIERRELSRLNHPMSPAELQALAPGFDWLGYLAARGQSGEQRINVTEPVFLREVARLLGTQRLADIKAYLGWSALRRHAPLLGSAFRDESFAFNERYLLGVSGREPRWKTCVAAVNDDLGDALGRAYVERTFPEETREQAVAMVGRIVASMRERIGRLTWMDESTREQALAKLDAMRFKVGHPRKWIDYAGLEIERDDHFGNRIRAARFEAARQLARIGRAVDRDEWILSAQDVDAFYDPQLNEMNLPAGILQPPLLDTRIDPAPGWGNTGMTIGHELIHGFDDTGRRFDAGGNLRDWWQPESAAEFEQRAQCLVEQFDGYEALAGVPVDGRLTLGENIADLGGTVLAFIGWKAATGTLGQDAAGGLTPEQRFFVGFAQWACANETPERARPRAATSIYAPRRHRVNGVVVNMPEFAEAFHCRPGQAMVKEPDRVCRIW